MFELNPETRAIKMTKADTAMFVLACDYTFQSGDKVTLTVKEDVEDTEPKMQVIITNFTDKGEAIFKFTTEDTNIPAGDYLYDIQIDFVDGRRYTIMYPTKFKIVDGITSN